VYGASKAITSVGTKKKPNILFCISDDQSWLHAGAYGDKVIKTPSFDRVAKEGVLFTHAFCAAPSCTPSRSAVLTGQQIWRLQQGANLFGMLSKKFKVYPMILKEAGYHVGFTGKGWGPGRWGKEKTSENPAGKRYDKIKCKPPRFTSDKDYAANFELFFKEKPEDKPFCFCYSSHEPHRHYLQGSGLESGKKLEDVKVPAFLPDTPEVRSDILDYYVKVEWFDKHLGRMIRLLEKTGELDNTIIVVTSDNGMPFPRGKATLYDYGVRMPLAVRWGAKAKGKRIVDDFVSLTDLAPTFLQAAGLDIPGEMTGQSFLDILLSDKAGRVDPARDKVFTAMERHAWCRSDGGGYPMRAVRTYRWLYIRNYEPGRWPAGDPDFLSPWTGIYGEVDNGPSKTCMIQKGDSAEKVKLFNLSFKKRPAEELYDVEKDPDQINNLAENPEFAETKKQLSSQLQEYLRTTEDPRAHGKAPWDSYAYHWPWYYCKDGLKDISVKTKAKNPRKK
jgi:uncharacterized sulfatase